MRLYYLPSNSSYPKKLCSIDPPSRACCAGTHHCADDGHVWLLHGASWTTGRWWLVDVDSKWQSISTIPIFKCLNDVVKPWRKKKKNSKPSNNSNLGTAWYFHTLESFGRRIDASTPWRSSRAICHKAPSTQALMQVLQVMRLPSTCTVYNGWGKERLGHLSRSDHQNHNIYS